MVLHINDLQLGSPTQSGHEVYQKAMYFPASSPLSGKHPQAKRIIFKKNKHQNSQFSRFEAAFTQLAQLFLAKNLTPSQQLVIDDSGEVVGVASEHFCYVVEQREGLTHSFYTLDNPRLGCACTAQTANAAEDIPIYFLDKVPQGFFARLLAAGEKGTLGIDYASLASILTSSYTLEEDDLHKGNFGFYIVQKEGKPQVVFFKIDHDMLFVDSIMSFYQARPWQIFHGESAFDITDEDLLDFPNISHSSNAYWPTKKSYFTKPWENKGYRSDADLEAFANLGASAEFKREKWRAFYKHILLSNELIEYSLKKSLEQQSATERAQVALMLQATTARQARLKAMLFSLKEFRYFVGSLTHAEKQSLLGELVDSSPTLLRSQISLKCANELAAYEQQVCSDGIVEGDTPLHIAIKLGDFRYEETLQMYGHFINQKNKLGQTPLDVALNKVHQGEAHPKDIRHDLRFTMKYLLNHGAEESEAFRQFNKREHIETYQFQTLYLNRVTKAQSYQELKEVLRDIGEDSSYCLKFKKNIAIQCVKKFIKTHQNFPELHEILSQLKKEMNGDGSVEDASGLKYIRQLRSRLWIIRQIRGLYGWTTTLGEINSLISCELKRPVAPEISCYAFFKTNQENDRELKDPEEDNNFLP